MSRRHRDLFPPDRGLQVRIAVALLLNVMLLAGVLAVVVWLLFAEEVVSRVLDTEPGRGGPLIVASLVLFAAVGLLVSKPLRIADYEENAHTSGFGTPWWRWSEASGKPPVARAPEPRDRELVESAVRRLCLVGDLEEPRVRVIRGPVPVSRTVVSHRRRELHVTTGLIDCLDEREIQAVVGHELSHLAHRDALVMAVLASPSVVVLRGLLHILQRGGREMLLAILCGWYMAPPALLLAGVSRVVSRHRELVADEGSALLTGSPSALAAALVRITEELEHVRRYERRRLAPGDPFHVLPVGPTPKLSWLRRLSRLWATHPPLARRLAQLERLERELQEARPHFAMPA